MFKQLFYLLIIIPILLACGGCSRDNRPADIPRLFPVTLLITLDDQPLDDALVVLHMENGPDAKWTVGSRTNTAGQAIITTHGQFRGAPAGKFKVCVSKSEGIEENGRPKLVQYVDPLFGDPKSTPLEIEVSAAGKVTNSTLKVHKPQ
jgi:hypothetical protein